MTAIWISWVNQRRNADMAEKIGADFYPLLSDRGRLWRYAILTARTLKLLRKKRPTQVYCQNPSIVLAVLVVVTRPLLKHRACIDQHNAGLLPLEGRSQLLQLLANYVQKNADLCIVSNQSLIPQVEKNGGRAVACPDPIPARANQIANAEPAPQRTIAVILSWAEDEPYDQILDAISQLEDQQARFCFTGSPPACVQRKADERRISLLGFISDQEYDQLLQSAYAVIVLTKRRDCLNRGAYEALAAGAPMLLSDTCALRQTFPNSAVFVDNSVDGICNGYRRLRMNYDDLVRGIPHDRERIEATVSAAVTEIKQHMSNFKV